MKNLARLTEGAVLRSLAGLAFPMLGGIFAVIAFNFADTYFVAQLGTRALVAMSFTFPVVMVPIGIAFGLGTGTTAVVSQAIGRGDPSVIKRLASDSLSLSFLTVLFFSAIGMLTIDPLFLLLGATPDILPLIRDYMMIWYPGMVFLVVPMVANANIRASGDTKLPALIMGCATIFNIILDPILIFGLFGAPRMELRGAALSTVIARGGAMIGALLILHFRDRLLDFKTPGLKDVWNSWKQIVYIAIPATVTNILQPLGLALVTRIIALQGPEVVAAWGAGSRVTAFSLIPVFALCSGLVPFVGQNWGAEKFSRVLKAQKYAHRFAFAWGILVAIVLHFSANQVASIFSEEPDVVTEIVRYLWIIPVGYALVGIFSVTEETLNAIGKPIIATVSTLIHMFALYVPLAFAGSYFYGVVGLLAGLAIADTLGGLVGLSLSRLMCRRGERECFAAAEEKEAV